MKKNYLFVIGLLAITLSYSQNTNFTNQAGAGDGFWNTVNNWNNGLPTATTPVTTISADVNLDVDASIISLRGADVTITGTNTITSIGTGNGIRVSGTYNINVPIVVNASANKTFQTIGGALNLNGGITLTTSAILNATSATRSISVNGVQTGVSALIIQGNVEFGANSDNSGLSAGLVARVDSTITDNTSGGILVASGSPFAVNGDDVKLILNEADTFQGNISIGGTDFTVDIDFNANQPNMGTVGFVQVGTGILNLNLDNSVTDLSFANSSATIIDNVNITGFKTNTIRFGTDNTGLTAAQLSNFTADGVASGEALGLDSNGYLALASTLTINELEANISKRISFPSVSNNIIKFTNPQTNFDIVNINGSVVLSNNTETESIDISRLNSGLYFLVFKDLNVSEKIIKN